MKFRLFLSDNSEITVEMIGIATFESFHMMLAHNATNLILFDKVENTNIGYRKQLVNISHIVSIIETL